jgi:mannosyltransferase OCH1-like enzyme
MIIFNNKLEQQKQQKLKQQEKINKYNETIKKYNENVKIMNNYKKLNVWFQLKETYNSIIPLHLYTCWHTKDLPPLMKANYDLLVQGNPKIEFHLYDQEDCRKFIQDNFENEVVEAYDSLIPCSYKSDLWRFCVLYIKGGIYMDIKYQCANGFKFISLTESEHFVRDRPNHYVYTALIVTKPNNQIMLNCITKIVENVKNKFYGTDALLPTGPGLLGNYFTDEEINDMKLYFQSSKIENKLDKFYIVNKDRIILKYYEGYRDEQKKYQKFAHYSQLWNERKIYN